MARTSSGAISGLTEGLIVHYTGTQPRHLAAIVSRVIDPIEGVVDLQVFRVGYQDGSAGIGVVQFDPGCTIGTWHLLEPVE